MKDYNKDKLKDELIEKYIGHKRLENIKNKPVKTVDDLDVDKWRDYGRKN